MRQHGVAVANGEEHSWWVDWAPWIASGVVSAIGTLWAAIAWVVKDRLEIQKRLGNLDDRLTRLIDESEEWEGGHVHERNTKEVGAQLANLAIEVRTEIRNINGRLDRSIGWREREAEGTELNMKHLIPILLLTLCGSLCAQTVELPIDTVQLNERFKAQDAELATLKQQCADQKSQLDLCWKYRSAVTIYEWGCKLDDPTFDNGVIFNREIEKAGSHPQIGRENRIIYCPGGAMFFKTPINLGRKSSLKIEGNGIGVTYSENHHHSAKAAGPASRWVYIGEPGQAAVTFGGFGLSMDGINIQNGEQYPPPTYEAKKTPKDGTVGLRIEGTKAPFNSGDNSFESICIAGFDIGLHITDAPDKTQADDTTVGHLRFNLCNTCIKNDNLQGLNWFFSFIYVGWGCENVFELDQCGSILVGLMPLNSPALVVQQKRRNSNAPGIYIDMLTVDSSCTGWRLIESVTQPESALDFRVRGTIAKHANPGPNPVNVAGKAVNLDIDMTRWGAKWDWGAK